ncbi:hypothetical protein NQ317_017416, partial [Molorchus minor]
IYNRQPLVYQIKARARNKDSTGIAVCCCRNDQVQSKFYRLTTNYVPGVNLITLVVYFAFRRHRTPENSNSSPLFATPDTNSPPGDKNSKRLLKFHFTPVVCKQNSRISRDTSVKRLETGTEGMCSRLVQRLFPNDKVNRLNFCRQFLEILNNNAQILGKLIMSDEVRSSLSPQWITVWYGVSAFSVVGPYSFKENGRAITVNSVRYSEMLETFVTAEL